VGLVPWPSVTRGDRIRLAFCVSYTVLVYFISVSKSLPPSKSPKLGRVGHM